MQFFFTTLLADAVKLKQTSFEYCTCKLILRRSDFHPVPSGRRDASLKETRSERHQRGVRPLSEGWQKKVSNASPGWRFPIHWPGRKERYFWGFRRKSQYHHGFEGLIKLFKWRKCISMFDKQATTARWVTTRRCSIQFLFLPWNMMALGFELFYAKSVYFFLNVLFIRVFMIHLFYFYFLLIWMCVNKKLCKIDPLKVEQK